MISYFKQIIMKIENAFRKLYEVMVQEKTIYFPSKQKIELWQNILNQWILKDSLPLFVRKSSDVRGSEIIHEDGRIIIKTDNTPAHWIFRRFVLNNEIPTFKIIKTAIEDSGIPLAMMRKKTEKEFLKNSQIASKDFRLGNENWKIAHIQRIALPRNKNITLEQYKEHHKKFLSLNNMYLIKKEFSGISEVDLFNQFISQHIN